MGRSYFGTSGWSYDAWQHGFYEGIPRSRWLEHCAERFSALEINATFYRRQRRETLVGWAEAVPDGFVFAVKGHRYVTHSRLLREPDEPIRGERERATALGPKLGPVLWQLPARLELDVGRLAGFARALERAWPEARHAIEFRHRSWLTAEVAEVLRDHRLANVISDAADWPIWDAVTADLIYVRLHGHTRTYASGYASSSLEAWAERIADWTADGHEVHVYFDNDAEGAAPYDAMKLRRLVEDG